MRLKQVNHTKFNDKCTFRVPWHGINVDSVPLQIPSSVYFLYIYGLFISSLFSYYYLLKSMPKNVKLSIKFNLDDKDNI